MTTSGSTDTGSATSSKDKGGAANAAGERTVNASGKGPCAIYFCSEQLAQTAALVMRLGNQDVGRKLIEEAAAMAAKLGTADRSPYARGLVAEAIAPLGEEPR